MAWIGKTEFRAPAESKLVELVPIAQASEAFMAFRGLLAWLVERQNALGLELQGRIGGLG